MHHQGQVTTEVGGDHFRSTGVKLWATVPTYSQIEEEPETERQRYIGV